MNKRTDYLAGCDKDESSAEINNDEWASLSYEEKNRRLFLRQKKTLAMFLEKGAISREQHDKSLHDLIQKMGAMSEE